MIVTSTEAAIQERLTQIDADDGALRAFIRVDQAEAIAAAVMSDRRRADGAVLGPLDGLATAVKDNLAVEGKPWTAGVAGRREVTAARDAHAVSRLRAGGAILLGGTNMDEAALGAVTDNPTFGRCFNPLGEGLTPGGSSGGSAAAVAAGFVDLAIGTDTMGSVRVPAAYCGIASIKPTFGAIDRDGLALLCPSLDTIGPMARDVRLLWPALRAMASPMAAAAWPAQDPPPDLSGVRFGVPTQLSLVDCRPEILDGLENARRAIGALGGTVRAIDLAGWNPHKARRAGLLVIEAEGAVELADLIDRPGAISDPLRAMLIYGRDAPPEKLAAAKAEIASAAHSATDALDDVDALLLPTAPQRAFAHGTPVPANQADLTALANFAGLPAVAIPAAMPGEVLPASVQIIGRQWSDPKLLNWAEMLAPRLT
ncbi:MAG: amidase [Pseudomonadota bacterium]